MLSLDNSFPFDNLNGGKSLFVSKNGNSSNGHHGTRTNSLTNAPSSSSRNRKLIASPIELSAQPSNDGMNGGTSSTSDMLMKFRNGHRLQRQTPTKPRPDGETSTLNASGLLANSGYQPSSSQNTHLPYALPKLNRDLATSASPTDGVNSSSLSTPTQLPKLESTLKSNKFMGMDFLGMSSGSSSSSNTSNSNSISNGFINTNTITTPTPLSGVITPSRSRQLLTNGVQNSRDRERERGERRRSRGVSGGITPNTLEAAMGQKLGISDPHNGVPSLQGNSMGLLNNQLQHRPGKSVIQPPPISTTPMVQEMCGNATVTSLKGVKPGRPDWINQDNFFMVRTAHGSDMYCVLDGHGEHGHLVSRKCRSEMPNLIISCHYDLKRAFALTQQLLLDSREMDAGCSGATCVLCIVSNNSLTLAHAGDSRAVMGKRTAVGGYSSVVLTQDHKPDRPDEKKRIQACGGHVGSRQVMIESMGGRVPSNVTTGPCRVWYKHGNDTMGLAMSRSLGDGIVHTCGVSAEPEILQTTLDPTGKDEFLILATDGLWDVIDSLQAVRIVGSIILRNQQNGTAVHDPKDLSPQPSADWSTQEASEHLCNLARKRWESVSVMIDDITCLVVKLDTNRSK